jgi:hydroxyacylglutathione hydrolase
MFFETIRSEGLAHNSYIIGQSGSAAVIDPRRDCEIYTDIARKNGAVITHIFETHRNEDYVIGSCQLAARTGAEIYHGTQLDFSYGTGVQNGDTFTIGDLTLRILHTPGHTYESISIAVIDTVFGSMPVAVFTGDTLFIGDVGRTDFFPDKKEETAGLLYDSIFERLLTLGDHVLLYPAHGAGSVCGGGMAEREFSSLGYERSCNPALKLDRKSFINKKVSEHHYIPAYFKKMEQYNQHGAPLLERLPTPMPCSADAFARAIDLTGLQVLDTRSPEAIAGAFISGSLTIPLAMVPAFSGWFLTYDRPIGLVVEQYAHLETAVRYLVRLGYDTIPIFLHQEMHAWETSGRIYDNIPVMHIEALKQQIADKKSFTLLDVRSRDEFTEEHLPDARHIYVGELSHRLGELPADKPVVTFCNSGERATIAASILKNNGFKSVSNCLGSILACKASGCPVVTA